MRPWKKWLLRTLVAIAIVAVICFGEQYWRQSRGVNRLNEARTRLDAEDPGWRFDQIQMARANRFPPDDENITKLSVKIHADTPKDFDAFLIRIDQPTPWLPLKEFNRLPPDVKVTEARKMRTVCKDAIDRSLKLQRLAGGGVIPPPKPNPLEISIEHVQRLRNTAALLKLNSVVAAIDGDGTAAIASCRAGLHLTRGVNDEPTLICMLVRVSMATISAHAAERVMAIAEPKTGLAEYQAELLHEADEPILVHGFRGERAWIDATFDFMQNDPAAFNAENDLGFLGSLSVLAYRSRLHEDQLIQLRIESEYLEIARRPSHEWAAKIRSVDLSEAKGPAVQLLLPAAERVTLAVLRSMARLRSLAVGLACERFRQTNGRWPKDLAEIPKSILQNIPRDPYFDAPIQYRLLPDGIVVYSIGSDLHDDEGNLTYENPLPGEDVGVRLWSPEFRRIAPLPDPE